MSDKFQTTLTDDDESQGSSRDEDNAEQDSSLITRTSEEEDNIISQAIRRLPSTTKIIDQAEDAVQEDILSPKVLKKSLSNAVRALHDSAYSIFLDEQKIAYEYALDKWLVLRGNEITAIGQKTEPLQFAKDICQMVIPFAVRLEKRLGNSRKSRAGATLEKIIITLLLKMKIPCEKPSKDARTKLKRIDIVVPNQEVALSTPDKAYFISCKRTLRERWKQATQEKKGSWRVYLITLDDDLSEEKVKEINDEGFFAYVLDNVKKQKHLTGKSWIRRLSDLPNDLKLEA